MKTRKTKEKCEKCHSKCFAEVDIATFRDVFREAQDVPEKIPSKLKPLIAMPDFPEKLLSMAKKAAA